MSGNSLTADSFQKIVTNYTNDEFDIVVVGAGLSGLTAALTLYEKDPHLKIVVIEATENIGGRHYTLDENLAFCSDCNYFLKQLLNKLNIKAVKRSNYGKDVAELTENFYEKGDHRLPTFGGYFGKLQIQKFLADMEDQIEHVSFHTPTILENSDELDLQSMENYICEQIYSQPARNFIRNLVETTCGVPAKKISVLFYMAVCNSMQGIANQFTNDASGKASYLIEGGIKRICGNIINIHGFDLYLRERVTEIYRYKYFVLVKTTKQTYRCAYVLIAVPPTELLKIIFHPELPQTRVDLLHGMHSYDYKTCLITFKDINWREYNLSGDVFGACPRPSHPVLRGYNVSDVVENGVFAIVTDLNPDKICNQLKMCYGLDGKDVPTTYVDKLWGEQLSYRYYFAPQFGCMSHIYELRRPLNRMFFAGSETATDWYGHLEGTVQSGFRAAVELMYDFKPQTLSYRDIAALLQKRKMVNMFKNRTMHQTTFYLKVVAVLCVAAGSYITINSLLAKSK